ncbi:uncharacterized protein LOC143213450 [Lasioglossum baleicum]|uniref:uncharacterized protein LOC143213450 n=1 Tax=Lasioglossum baleicum TaxID=434251 RepID=UPI003FCED9AC
MADPQPDNCLSIEENESTCKENSRIAEAAANTLCKLNSIIKQMKNWQDDRVKLKSNIWQLKLALRAAGKETDDVLHADPLIEHQRATIKRLKGVNQALKKEIADFRSSSIEGEHVVPEIARKSDDNLRGVKQQFDAERMNEEIVYLRTRLKELENGQEDSSDLEHFKCRLKHFMMVDHTVEIIFIDIVNRVAETIANLYEELANVSEHLQVSRLKNDNLRIEVDRLRAMLRSKCDDSLLDYQKRIVELDNLANHLKMELRVCKANSDSKSWNMTNTDQCNLKNAERLADELKKKLRNDYEAFLAAGDPSCLEYIKKIVELRVNLKHLHVELKRPPRYSDEVMEYNRYLQQVSTLDVNLKHICIEIDKFKIDHATKNCKLGEIEGLEYLKKVEELQVIIQKARMTINGLTRGSNEGEDVEKLEDLVDRMCHGIKQLEVIVTSHDSSSLFKRVEQLEESIVRLKVELNEKDERTDLIKQKLSDTEASLEKRTGELKDTQRMVSSLTEENKILKAKAKKMENKVSMLQRERENDKSEMTQLQQSTNQVNVMKTKLQSLQTDKEGLFKELGRLRNSLQKKNDEIKLIVSEKDAMEKALKAINVEKNQAVSKDKTKLNKKVDIAKADHKTEKKPDNNVQLKQLQEELDTSMDNLNNARLEVISLKDDKMRLEESIRCLESIEKMREHQLETEKTLAREKAKEQAKLIADYNELAEERLKLRNERNHLMMKMDTLRIEKELLEKSMRNLNTKYSEVENELGEYKYQCNELREEIRNFKISTDDLASKLGDAQAELNGAGDKIKQLECENSRNCNSLLQLTLKNTDFKSRMQVLLAEKDDLTTRINELDAENARLKDQLNKVKTENEYSSVELNKLRTERDKAGSENASLRNTLDETKNSNETLRRTVEDLKMKLSNVYSEHRVLENQLKILELMNATLKKEKDTLYREYLDRVRSEYSQAEKEDKGSMKRREQECVPEKGDNQERKDSAKPGKRANETTNTKKDELKKLIVENKALKFELSNLKSENYEVKMKLNRTREEFQRQQVGLLQSKTNETALRPIMNLYYKEISSYSSHFSDDPMGIVTCIDQASVCYGGELTDQQSGMEIERLLELANKMKIENVALKMELYNLRCNFVANFSEDERRYRELQDALEEIRALKTELTKLRDEKESLQIRLEASETKLHRLESEKVALKDELYALRNMNADLKRKANELQNNYQKLRERNRNFEGCIMGALKKIKKYTLSMADITDDDLKAVLTMLITNEEFLQSIDEVEVSCDESRYADAATV